MFVNYAQLTAAPVALPLVSLQANMGNGSGIFLVLELLFTTDENRERITSDFPTVSNAIFQSLESSRFPSLTLYVSFVLLTNSLCIGVYVEVLCIHAIGSFEQHS